MGVTLGRKLGLSVGFVPDRRGHFTQQSCVYRGGKA